MEVPWPLGPPDGRYLVREAMPADAAGIAGPPGDLPASHVLLFATLGAARRRRRPR